MRLHVSDLVSINMLDIFYKGSYEISLDILTEKFNKNDFIIVVGKIGIGKSVYAKNMSKYNETLYLEFNSIKYVPKKLRRCAKDIISINSVKDDVDLNETQKGIDKDILKYFNLRHRYYNDKSFTLLELDELTKLCKELSLKYGRL